MLIGKKLYTILFVAIFLSACADSGSSVNQHGPQESWWLSKEFTALENEILGIPLAEINKDWKSVSILNKEFLKKHLNTKEYSFIQDSSLVFSLEVDLDGNVQLERILVGIYKSYTGEVGRFIAIKQGRRIIEYFSHMGFSGYSSLHLEGNKVKWYKCMACNDYDLIHKVDSGYVLE